MPIKIDWELAQKLAEIGKWLIEDESYVHYCNERKEPECVICLNNVNQHAIDCPIPPALEAWQKSYSRQLENKNL